jgi:transcriptional regulator with XRE-family HTH domain
MKGWTQEELGDQAEVNYKFLGEIERGNQNPSFSILLKIANALDVEFLELFRLEPEISDRKEIETRIRHIVSSLPDDELHRILMLLRAFYPTY